MRWYAAAEARPAVARPGLQRRGASSSRRSCSSRRRSPASCPSGRPGWPAGRRPPPSPPRSRARRSRRGGGSGTRGGPCACTPRPSPASQRHDGPRARRRTTTCWPCPGSVTTPRRLWRPSRSGSATWSSTPTCAGCSPGWTPARRSSARGRRARPSGRRADELLPADAETVGHLERRAHGARRPRLHGALAALRRLPGRRLLRVAARRLTRLGRAAAARSDVRRHRPPGTRAAARRAPRPVRAGAGRRPRRRRGADPRQQARALDGLVADGLVEPVGDDGFRLPGRHG